MEGKRRRGDEGGRRIGREKGREEQEKRGVEGGWRTVVVLLPRAG